MKRLFGVGSALLCLAVVSSGSAECRDGATNVDKGRVLLEDNCARCHAIGKDDASAHKEAPPFREVMVRYSPDNLAEALAEGIVSGHPDMPVFVFQPPEIDAIVSYLGTLEPKSRNKD